MSATLKGKTLVITGASRGIGLAIAKRAAADGANVVLLAKTVDPNPKLPGTLHSAAEEVQAAGGQALPVQTDIREEAQVLAAVPQSGLEAVLVAVELDGARPWPPALSAAVANEVANTPPVGSLFAAFLGYNPIAELLAPHNALQQPGVNAEVLTGKTFFPNLIIEPFHSGLVVVFGAAAVMMVIGAIASIRSSRVVGRP